MLFDAKSTLSDAFFGVFGFGTVLFLVLADSPVLLDGGSSSGGGQICQNAEIPPSFMSLPCIFCKRMHLQYIEAFLVSTLWGFAPNPSLTWAPQGQAVKTQPPDPVAKCWVGSKASRVKCTASPPLTPLHLRESSKTIRKRMELETCQGLRSNRLRLGLYRLEATQRFCGKGAGGFPLHPLPRGERGCGQRPRCWQDPWGSRSRGTVCRRHSF